MPGYKPQVKSKNGDMVDIPIAATYDENGNKFDEQYVSIDTQTFTEEQKAKARANIGAVSASEIVTTLYDHYIKINVNSNGVINDIVTFVIRTKDKTPFTIDSLYQWLYDRGFYYNVSTFGGGNYNQVKFFFPLCSSFLAHSNISFKDSEDYDNDEFTKVFGISCLIERNTKKYISVYSVYLRDVNANGSSYRIKRISFDIEDEQVDFRDNVIGAYGEIVE